MKPAITPDLLRRLGAVCTPLMLRVHADALSIALQGSDINTPRRLAAFLGQIMVETGRLSTLAESFAYRDPARLDALFRNVRDVNHARTLIECGEEAIANCAYGGRRDLGNGSEESGDGWRFRGSGYMQVTGRANFAAFGKVCGVDLLADPDQARKPLPAARLAVAYWSARKCSPMADRGDIEGITRAVNGPAMLHLYERRAATSQALDVLGA